LAFPIPQTLPRELNMGYMLDIAASSANRSFADATIAQVHAPGYVHTGRIRLRVSPMDEYFEGVRAHSDRQFSGLQ
jgi:hypothetical protein